MENLRLQITHSTQPFCSHIALKGNLCGMEAIDLKQELLHYIDSHVGDLELDLRAVRQIDLGGINALAVTYRKVQAKGLTMSMLIPNEGPLRHLLQLTKMSNCLPLREVAAA